MNDRERRHALALNEAHAYFGGIDKLTYPERVERLRYVERRDGIRSPEPGSLDAMMRDQIERRSR